MKAFLKHISDIALFATVVSSGGISRGAAKLGMERTTVSRRLAAFERYVGAELLIRSNKRIELTDAGRRCFEHAIRAVQAAAEVAASARMDRADGDTVIRVGAPVLALDALLKPLLKSFSNRSPDCSFRFSILGGWSARRIGQLDLAFMPGPPGAAPPAYAVRAIAAARQSMVAGPAYLEAHGQPLAPDALSLHRWISYPESEPSLKFSLHSATHDHDVELLPDCKVPDMLTARQSAVADLGLCLLPVFVCEDQLAAGELVEVLPAWRVPELPITIAWRRDGPDTDDTAALVSYLTDALRTHPQTARYFSSGGERHNAIGDCSKRNAAAPKNRHTSTEHSRLNPDPVPLRLRGTDKSFMKLGEQHVFKRQT